MKLTAKQVICRENENFELTPHSSRGCQQEKARTRRFARLTLVGFKFERPKYGRDPTFRIHLQQQPPADKLLDRTDPTSKDSVNALCAWEWYQLLYPIGGSLGNNSPI